MTAVDYSTYYIPKNRPGYGRCRPHITRTEAAGCWLCYNYVIGTDILNPIVGFSTSGPKAYERWKYLNELIGNSQKV